MEFINLQKYLGVPQTDKHDRATVEAIIKFQKKNNLPENGFPSKELYEKVRILKAGQIKANKRNQQKIRHPLNRI